MFKRAVRYYRLLNRPGKPEESKGFRVAVLITVLISVVAAVGSEAVGLGVGIPVVLGVIAGSYYSYRVRKRSNLLLKFILTILLLIAFAAFWVEFNGYINDLRYPLVRLFLWLQVLHSFDLPTRRDLDFSLVSATILMAFAGSLSISSGFLYLLIPFFVSGIISLYLERRSTIESSADALVKGSGGSTRRAVLLAGIVVVPLTLAFFVALPRLPGFYGSFLPVSRDISRQQSFEGLIRNPGYGKIPESFPAKPPRFNPDAYFGFSRFLDLRMRGIPSKRIVMKVRSPFPAYWRSTAFDRFIGNGWENTEKDQQEIYSGGQPLTVDYKGSPPQYVTSELVQTVFVERDLPNTIFAAFLPREVFFPSHVLKVDSMMTVLSPIILDRGLIYTVISQVSDATPDMLRGVSGPYPPGLKERFCALPPLSGRVEELARSITANIANDYDKVEALSNYLKANYPYDLRVRPQGDRENTVEFFLFEERRGFCEHFATTLAVMCRTVGIPARVAVGFDSGRLNPLTGYYEVTESDAHSWVEVYFPFFGWMQFDPTPGWSNPRAFGGREDTWVGFSLFRYVKDGLSRIFPPGFRRAISTTFKKVWSATRAAASAITRHWAGILLALGALAIAAVLALVGGRLKRRGAARPPPQDPRQAAVSIIDRMYGVLTRAGLPRRPSQTPSEYAEEVHASIGLEPAVRATEIFNVARYGCEDPGERELAALDELVRQVEEAVAARRRGRRTRLRPA